MIAFTNEQAETMLQRLVAAFNDGVRTGDFARLTELFTADGVLEFEGVNDYGPFIGRDAIALRYRSDPPDDQIRITRWKTSGDRIVAEFKWLDIPEAIGGCLIVTPRGEEIAQTTVAFGGPHCSFR